MEYLPSFPIKPTAQKIMAKKKNRKKKKAKKDPRVLSKFQVICIMVLDNNDEIVQCSFPTNDKKTARLELDESKSKVIRIGRFIYKSPQITLDLDGQAVTFIIAHQSFDLSVKIVTNTLAPKAKVTRRTLEILARKKVEKTGLSKIRVF